MDDFKKHLIRFFDLEEFHAHFLYGLLRYHMCQLRFNTSTISVNALTMIEDEEDGGVVRDVVQQKLGFAVYLKASLFNHSCDPNAFFRFLFQSTFFILLLIFLLCVNVVQI